ncbi:MAG TPA: response regulator [Stellaceae bacterium]|nr:response regulator [Stellaceae bacterium]
MAAPPQPPPAGFAAAASGIEGRARLAAVGLAAAGALPPIAVAGLPGVFALLARHHLAAPAIALLVLGPAATGLAAFIRGPGGFLARRAGALPDEPRLAGARLCLAAAILAYALGLAVLLPAAAGVGAVLTIALLEIAAAWLVLFSLICRPAASRVRRNLALAADVGLLSALLHAGGGLAAAWYPAYFGVILANAFGFGLAALLPAALASAAGFAAVAATTAFWQQQGALAGSLAAALVLVPGGIACLVRALAATAAFEPRATPAPPPRPARLPLRILVAEDSASNRKLIERVLTLAGHRVRLVEDGEEAVRALAAGDIDLVLMDVNMPRIGGYEATRLCRMAYPRLPILALTGESGAESERACREAGMDAVLVKPVEPERLVAAVEAAAFGEAEAPARPSAGAPVVTSIASHPRFLGEAAAIVDEAVVASLEGLGAGREFLGGVIEAFRGDAGEVLPALSRAAAAADLPQFRECLHALGSCAANVGGTRLCELLRSMRELTAGDLRRDGAAFVERVAAELGRLDGALADYLEAAAAARR